MKPLKKKMTLFAVTLVIILIGMMTANGEMRMKKGVIELKQGCSDAGYDFINNIYSSDNGICVQCSEIVEITKRTTIRNEITVCSQMDDFLF